MRTLGKSFVLAMFNAASALVVGVLTARWAGPEAQGTLAAIATVGAVCTLIFSLGTGTSLRLDGRAGEMPRVRAVLVISIGGGLAAALGTALTSEFLGFSTPISLASSTLGAAVFLGRQASDYVQARGYVFLSIASVGLGACVQLAFVVAYRLFGEVTVLTCLASMTVGALAQVAACLLVGGRGFVPGPERAWDVVRTLVRVGWPTLGFGLGLIVLQRVDRLYVTMFAGSVANGFYSVAATVGEGARLVSMVVGQVLFVRVAAEGVVSRASKRLAMATVGLQVAGSVVVSVFSASLVGAVFGNSYGPSAQILPWLLFAECLMAVAMLGARLLMGLGRVSFVGGVTGALALIALAVYPPMVTQFGAIGAAYASCVLYALYGIIIVLGLAHGRSAKPS